MVIVSVNNLKISYDKASIKRESSSMLKMAEREEARLNVDGRTQTLKGVTYVSLYIMGVAGYSVSYVAPGMPHVRKGVGIVSLPFSMFSCPNA